MKLAHWQWLVLSALFARLLNIGAEHFWYDEAFTAAVVHPATDFWRAALGDTHPPLWNIIMLVTTRIFGISEWSMRLPAALIGVLNVLLVWQIAKQLGFERRAAFQVGLFAAAMPAFIYFGQDARQYSLYTFYILLCVWAAMRGNWYIFFFAAVGAVYTHNVSLIYVGLIALVGLRVGKRMQGVLTLALVGMAWSPFAVHFIKQVGVVGDSFWLAPMSAGQVLQSVAMNTLGWRLPDLLQLIGIPVVFSLTGAGAWFSRSWMFSQRGRVVLVAALGVPLALATISTLWTNIYVFRAVQPSAWLLILLWQAPLTRPLSWLRVAAAVLVALGVVSHYLTPRDDLTAWTDKVKQEWREGDVIYFSEPSMALNYGHYADLPFYVRPTTGNLIGLPAQSKIAFHLRESTPWALLESYERVWIFTQRTPFTRFDEENHLGNVKATTDWQVVATRQLNSLTIDYIYMVQRR